ncbi:serine protease [Streptosporangium sp. 'caverna']|uniref:trypsin-like serine peptidase n=1 Tax=Streptosporangium sp. 'caverna' TaxID=2202249 RepID=UPI000D7E37C7|nr:hypothetical protein [Streptosporangium sp. 'caverna']AWS46576.1 hypothetical protein DKM19_40040 [Streptosporangium sp. 'caverna']
MKRILLPAGGALLATGLLAAGLAGTASANANPDWATDTMAKDAPTAQATVDFWTQAQGTTNNLAKATAYTTETTPASKLNTSGGYTPDGKPGVVAPIGEEKATTSVVKNVNLPKSIGKVFFVDSKNQLKWCSATSIQSKYRNLVSTAGHCVYDDKANAAVMDHWVFVPGYYQGKTPWGIYVGKTAYVHYDFSVYNDRDRDYAFVTVYNGIQVGGGTPKVVSEADYKASTASAKFSKDEAISKEEYKKIRDLKGGETSDAWAKVDKVSETVGPDYPGAVVALTEVSKDVYDAAPDGRKNGAKAPWKTRTENVTKAQYDAYTGVGYRKLDKRGNYTITHYFTKSWVKETQVKGYFKTTFYIVDGFIKDAGRLGDNVGGQGFTWNQKAGQTVYVFGYPAGAHPDGNKAFTGVTPKWCYGKTLATKYVSAADKVEEHVGLKCSMTTGSDGAPWLVKYSSAKRLGYVNGTTSLFGDTDKNGRIDVNTSAYFDGETAAVYNKAAAVWSGSIVTK